MTTASTTARRAFTGAATFLFTWALCTFGLGITAAFADTPAGPDWPVGEPRSTLDTLLLAGGGTIGLIVLVTLFGLLTSRNNYVPPPPSQDLAIRPGTDVQHPDTDVQH